MRLIARIAHRIRAALRLPVLIVAALVWAWRYDRDEVLDEGMYDVARGERK